MHINVNEYSVIRKVSVRLLITTQKVYWNNSHTIVNLKIVITEYIRNVNRAILNTVSESTVQRVNKYQETGGGHLDYYL
jgi:hypothetical protein